MSDDLKPAAQIEALRDLIDSQGWQVYRQMVMAEIQSEFEDNITKALSSADGAIAIDKARQVAAVRLAGLRWLKLPHDKLQALQEQVRHTHEQITRIGRRPVGL